MEERFVNLETKIAYLERYQEELNEVVTSQQKEIDGLMAQVSALINHFQSAGPATDPRDEPPPPHY